MKWYNFETAFSSLKDELRAFLKKHKIRYELSGAAACWHFEIFTDANGVGIINNFLDSLMP